jgi:cob(I)alamin adenosyltransferase
MCIRDRSEQEKRELKEDIDIGFEFIKGVIENKECDILIIDELLGVLSNKLLETDNVLKLLAEKPEDMEIIITGRNASKEIIEVADLVTEMKQIKHYFNNGIHAREGIES